jgi:hypothetical protein
MVEQPRYRVEDGLHNIDVRIESIEHMFDNRDPAPFRARDLDPDLVEYLIAAAEDVSHEPFRVVFWLRKMEQAKEIEPAFRAHMQYELERVARRIRRQRREGQVVLAIGIAVLVALFGLGQLAERLPGGEVIHELLHLASWVVMWRPIDTLVYQGLPMFHERKLMRRLCGAPLDVRTSQS